MTDLGKLYEYSMNIYYVVMEIEGDCEFLETTRRTISAYIYHCCKSLGCPMYMIKTLRKSSHFLIKLNPELLLGILIDSIKDCTAKWIIENAVIGSFTGWRNNFYYGAVTPMRKEKTADFIKDLSDDFDFQKMVSGGILMQCSGNELVDMSEMSMVSCHHVIFGTKNATLTLKTKFESLMVDKICEISKIVGCHVYLASMWRNHVHILVNISPHLSINNYVDFVKSECSTWMLTNIHFHRVKGWGRKFCSRTVSQSDFVSEDRELHIQEEIHKQHTFYNELLQICLRQESPQPLDVY